MKRLDISDQTAVSMPMKNLIAIVVAVAVGVWAYFGIVERINKLETQSVLIQKDMNAEDERETPGEFRVQYTEEELKDFFYKELRDKYIAFAKTKYPEAVGI